VVAADVVNAGRVLADGAGSIEIEGKLVNSGLVGVDNGGSMRLEDGIANGSTGRINVDVDGHLEVMGASTGGIARIRGNNAILEFEGSATTRTTTRTVIAAENARLEISNSSRFEGLVAGFDHDDTIAVKDVAFVAGKSSYDAATRALTVSDGTNTAQIQLIGQYMASQFVFASDGQGGTQITVADPASAFAVLASPV
jgi:hypothetical protein